MPGLKSLIAPQTRIPEIWASKLSSRGADVVLVMSLEDLECRVGLRSSKFGGGGGGGSEVGLSVPSVGSSGLRGLS